MTRGDKAVVSRLLKQLLKQNVYSVCEETGAIYSRRMVQDANLHEVRGQAGRKGYAVKSLINTDVKNPESTARTQNPQFAQANAQAKQEEGHGSSLIEFQEGATKTDIIDGLSNLRPEY